MHFMPDRRLDVEVPIDQAGGQLRPHHWRHRQAGWGSTKGYIGKVHYFDVLKHGVAHESRAGYVTQRGSINNQIKAGAGSSQKRITTGVTGAH